MRDIFQTIAHVVCVSIDHSGFSRTAHEVVPMSRDEFPSAPCSRGLRIVVSSHLVLLFSASVHTVVMIWSDVSILFSARSFPLEREEVQTLRSAISSRTRAVDGFSLKPILGVSRENESLDTFIITFHFTFCFDHTSHHIEVTVIS